MAAAVAAILAAAITGGLSLLGTIYAVRLTVKSAHDETIHTLETNNAVMHAELANLRRETEKHNKFAERVPAAEAAIENIGERLNRVEDIVIKQGG